MCSGYSPRLIIFVLLISPSIIDDLSIFVTWWRYFCFVRHSYSWQDHDCKISKWKSLIAQLKIARTFESGLFLELKRRSFWRFDIKYGHFTVHLNRSLRSLDVIIHNQLSSVSYSIAKMWYQDMFGFDLIWGKLRGDSLRVEIIKTKIKGEHQKDKLGF